MKNQLALLLLACFGKRNFVAMQTKKKKNEKNQNHWCCFYFTAESVFLFGFSFFSFFLDKNSEIDSFHCITRLDGVSDEAMEFAENRPPLFNLNDSKKTQKIDIFLKRNFFLSFCAGKFARSHSQYGLWYIKNDIDH